MGGKKAVVSSSCRQVQNAALSWATLGSGEHTGSNGTAWDSHSFLQVSVQARAALETARLTAGILTTPGDRSSRQVSVWSGEMCGPETHN